MKFKIVCMNVYAGSISIKENYKMAVFKKYRSLWPHIWCAHIGRNRCMFVIRELCTDDNDDDANDKRRAKYGSTSSFAFILNDPKNCDDWWLAGTHRMVDRRLVMTRGEPDYGGKNESYNEHQYTHREHTSKQVQCSYNTTMVLLLYCDDYWKEWPAIMLHLSRMYTMC